MTFRACREFLRAIWDEPANMRKNDKTIDDQAQDNEDDDQVTNQSHEWGVSHREDHAGRSVRAEGYAEEMPKE